jgi:uncharacterized membrane protein YcaP (DUF421 family)
MNEIFYISLRSAIVYVCIVLMIRIFGKKELSQLSVTDLVFILLISNSVQSAMVGTSTSLWGGLIAAGTLFTLNAIVKFLIFKFKPVERFLEGEPTLLVYNGRMNIENLRKEQITIEELNSSIREHGIKDLSEVDLAILEADGNISVLSENYKKKTVKKRKHHKVLRQNQ